MNEDILNENDYLISQINYDTSIKLNSVLELEILKKWLPKPGDRSKNLYLLLDYQRAVERVFC